MEERMCAWQRMHRWTKGGIDKRMGWWKKQRMGKWMVGHEKRKKERVVNSTYNKYNSDRERASKCKWLTKREDIKDTNMRDTAGLLGLFSDNLHGGEMKNKCSELPTSPYNSRTPLKSWTKRLRERRRNGSLVPHLFALSPHPLSFFLLSCPLCKCSISVLMSLGPTALFQCISIWTPFFLSLSFLSSLTLPPTSANPSPLLTH